MSVNKTTYSRTEVYLGDTNAQPKYMFVRMAEIIGQSMPKEDARSLLDVGAASGAFLRYMKACCPAWTFTGLDFDPKLIENARQLSSDVNYLVGDANRMDALASSSFDVVTMIGTHSIFDDFRTSFAECIRVAKANGKVVVTGLFNNYPVDALIYWRYGGKFDDAWHPGYNLFSKASLAAFLESHPRVNGFAFEPFNFPLDLEPREDVIRSWTEKDSDGERYLRNGIMPLSFETLVIEVA
jgi:SAM-dependent methyltransferase